MTYIYLAAPMDEAHEAKRNVAIKQVTAALEGQFPIFSPATGWLHGKGVEGIQDVNMYAVMRSRVLIAMVLPDTPSAGVPLELGYAYGLGIPVVVLVANVGDEEVKPPTALLGFPRTTLAGLSEAVHWAWDTDRRVGSGETEEANGTVLPLLKLAELEPEQMRCVLSHGKATLPERAVKGDAGFDLASSVNVTIQPGQTMNVPTDVFVQLPEYTWGFLVGRSSSFYKKQLHINPAVIDNGYRGELLFSVRNMGEQPYTVAEGERLAQLIVMPLLDVEAVQVDTLDPSDRGDSGFGSTG